MRVKIEHLGIIQADKWVIASIATAYHDKALKEKEDGYPTLAEMDYKITSDLVDELRKVGYFDETQN